MAGASASAEFTSMKISTLSGEPTILSLEQLEMTIEDGNLLITNADGSYSLPVDNLQSMSFSNEEPSAAIALTTIAPDAAVVVYGIDGRAVGTFLSPDDARTALSAGLYILKSTDGSTSKIAVKQ